MQKAESKNQLKTSKMSTEKPCSGSNREIIIGFEEDFVDYHTIYYTNILLREI